MENEKFTYTYSARRDGAAAQRKPFSDADDTIMEELRRLDQKISSPGTAAGIALGVVGTLVFGLGLSCVTVWNRLFLGALVGVIGIAGIALAYPLFDRITKKQREKYASDLTRLTNELGKR